MAAPDPFLHGPLAGHPLAAKFACEVHRVHRRYASEVVQAHRLCPHLHDVDKDFGVFVVMLDPRAEPDVQATVDAVQKAGAPIMHIVFPLIAPPPSAFERFAGKLSQALKRALPKPPVMATFHPALVGDANDPHRLIGLIRRAPDPFVQLIPDGYHDGGTMFTPVTAIGDLSPASEKVEWSQRNFDKLRGEPLDKLLALLASIRADRDRSYAPFVEALAAA
jgi:hypothetical protein